MKCNPWRVGKSQGICCKTLLCSFHRPTTHCIKRPHPLLPTSPTGALNTKEPSSDHYQSVPELWTSLLSCLQGTVSVGRDWGLVVGWVGGTAACGGMALCVCVCLCECAVCGGMCNLKLVVCPRSAELLSLYPQNASFRDLSCLT